MPLTDIKIRSLKPAATPRKASDGGGLHIVVTPRGSKLWRMAYRFDGRQKTLSFGAYPATPLALARERRDRAKAALARGEDPAQIARAAKHGRRLAARNTFAVIASEVIEKAEREGRALVTVQKKRWLLGLAMNDLGGRPIADITPLDVLECLRKVEGRGKLETPPSQNTTSMRRSRCIRTGSVLATHNATAP
jgi:hypothetical protein